MNPLILVIILLASLPARATVHWIWQGSCIQTAVDTAYNGDSLLIAEGVYNETVVLYGKSLTIGSNFVIDGDTSHVSGTIIRPGGTRPDTNSCFVYAYGETAPSRLVGLTLRDGTGTFWEDANSFAGGGVYACTSSVSIEHCRIAQCEAAYGGGAVEAAVDHVIRGEIHVTDCRFDSCSAWAFGGGIYCEFAHVAITGSRFERNQSAVGGGGAAILDAVGTVDSSVFHENWAWDSGGLVCGGGAVNVLRTVFDSNYARAGCTGHLLHFSSNGGVFGCEFRNNQSNGTSIVTQEYVYPTYFIGNLVELNNAGSNCLQIWDTQGGEIAYNIFRQNTDSHGAVITTGSHASSVRIHHNLIQDNQNQYASAGTVFMTQEYACPVLDSNWIEGNNGQTLGVWPPSDCVIDARYNWWGDPSGPYHPAQNPGGQGDTILSDSVLFIPWLTEPPDTSMPNRVATQPPQIPSTWRLLDCYPNPFNSSLRIILAGFTGRDFEITLHNLLGEAVDVIHRGPMTGGEITYQAPPYLASGVYFIRATDRIAVQTRKVVLLK